MSEQIELEMSAPLDVELDITSKCQLDCSYCSAAPLLGHEIPTVRVIDLLNEMGDLGVFSLLISGGEPTIHPGILDILKTAATKIPIITINTNGIRLSRMDFARKFNEAAPFALVSISLDSTDVSINDLQRGAGGNLAKRAIENCCELGQPINISCVLTETSINSAESLIDSYYPHVKKFSFFPRIPRDIHEIPEDTTEFWEKVKAFANRIERRCDIDSQLDVMLPFKKLLRAQRGALFDEVTGCCCAYTRMYINSQLKAYPCYYSASKETLLGSVEIGSLSIPWTSAAAERLRIAAKSKCLCGVSFFSDKIPQRFLDLEHRQQRIDFVRSRAKSTKRNVAEKST